MHIRVLASALTKVFDLPFYSRGSQVVNHPGNICYREIIRSKLPEYSRASTRVEKSSIVTSMIDQVRDSNGGGFIKKRRNGKKQAWYDVGDNVVREKTGQALRDLLHDKYKSSTKQKKERRKAAIAKVEGVLSMDISPMNTDNSNVINSATRDTTIATTRSKPFNNASDGNTLLSSSQSLIPGKSSVPFPGLSMELAVSQRSSNVNVQEKEEAINDPAKQKCTSASSPPPPAVTRLQSDVILSMMRLPLGEDLGETRDEIADGEVFLRKDCTSSILPTSSSTCI